MNLTVHKTPDDLALAVNAWIEMAVEDSTEALFLPAGNTLRPVYKLWRQKAPSCFEHLRLLQMDEILEGPKKNSFQDFFLRELPNFSVEIPKDKAFTGSAIAVLGLGVNGHVAFHEPGLPKDFSFGRVHLTESSAKELQTPPGTAAISYGIATFLRCSALLLVVTGAKKNAIFHRLKAKDPMVPASALLAHPKLWIYCDEEAFRSSC